MIKDPLHPEETPYDILGLDPNVSMGQVHQALAAFMQKSRRNRGQLPQAMQSRQVLSDPRQRLAVDVLYYSLKGIEDLENVGNANLELEQFLQVPSLHVNELFNDLELPDFSSDETPIEFLSFSFPPELRWAKPEDQPLNVPLER